MNTPSKAHLPALGLALASPAPRVAASVGDRSSADTIGEAHDIGKSKVGQHTA